MEENSSSISPYTNNLSLGRLLQCQHIRHTKKWGEEWTSTAHTPCVRAGSHTILYFKTNCFSQTLSFVEHLYTKPSDFEAWSSLHASFQSHNSVIRYNLWLVTRNAFLSSRLSNVENFHIFQLQIPTSLSLLIYVWCCLDKYNIFNSFELLPSEQSCRVRVRAGIQWKYQWESRRRGWIQLKIVGKKRSWEKIIIF